MQRQKQNNMSSFFMLLLYALMIGAVLLLTVVGGRLYASYTNHRTANDQKRATLSYIQSRISTADAVDGVRIEAGPEGDALVLVEGDTGYETRIYESDGKLLEEFVASTKEIQPETASEIAAVQTFSLQWVTKQLLCVQTDGDTAYVSLESEQTTGGASDE